MQLSPNKRCRTPSPPSPPRLNLSDDQTPEVSPSGDPAQSGTWGARQVQVRGANEPLSNKRKKLFDQKGPIAQHAGPSVQTAGPKMSPEVGARLSGHSPPSGRSPAHTPKSFSSRAISQSGSPSLGARTEEKQRALGLRRSTASTPESPEMQSMTDAGRSDSRGQRTKSFEEKLQEEAGLPRQLAIVNAARARLTQLAQSDQALAMPESNDPSGSENSPPLSGEGPPPPSINKQLDELTSRLARMGLSSPRSPR